MTEQPIYKDLNGKELFKFVLDNLKAMHLRGVVQVVESFNNPQDTYDTIHITGSNGKGSTANALKDVLVESGRTVGFYTSPHLIHPNERIRVNNKPISDEDFERIGKKILDRMDELGLYDPKRLSGVLPLVAYLYFAEQGVDIALIEVGIGGRTDMTNVINPLVSVITNVSLDHTEMLGKYIHEIAYNKGGIIKFKRPVVLGTDEEVTVKTISLITEQLQSQLYIRNRDFEVSSRALTQKGQTFVYTTLGNDGEHEKSLAVTLEGLHGEFQVDNMAGVLKTLEILNELGYNMSEEVILEGLRKSTWGGRFEYLNENVILDGSHNEAGILALHKTLTERHPNDEFVVVYSNIITKDYKTLIDFMDDNFKNIKEVIFTEVPTNKRLDCKELYLLSKQDTKMCVPIVLDALELAKKHAKNGEKILIFGSLYLATQVKLCIEEGFTFQGVGELALV